MSVSLEYLTQCAAETGYRVEPLEKVVRLGNLAGDIARHPLLGPVLALKGGTALNLCYGPPKRLSVDLDYNYVGEIERRKMLEDRPRVEAAAAEIAKRQGYRVQQSADAFAGRKLYLRYRSVLGQEERIELDPARLVGSAWAAVERLLELAPNEEAFTAAVENGEVPTDLLFQDDQEEARRAASHPAIQWKIENVRGHIARGVKTSKKPPQSKRHR